MAFTPNSTVYLLDIPLDNGYKNQIHFSSLSAQYSYFSNHVKHRFNDVTYQRKDNTIQVNKNIDDLWNVSYVMYRNDNFNTKWFYAFITKMEYVNANVTSISIETDVYQTWLQECTLKKSFVVREHVNNDIIGVNIIDEGLELGEYTLKSYSSTYKLEDISFVIGNSLKTDNTPDEGEMYGNIYSGLRYVVFGSENTGAMTEYLNSFVSAGHGDAINFIFTIPTALLPTTLTNNAIANVIPVPFTRKVDAIDGYTPKNKKLYNYPYSVMYVSNNQGSSATFRFEDFADVTDIDFEIVGSITPDPKIMICPKNYKGIGGRVQEYGLTMSGFPFCSWNNDLYSAWLAQNSVTLGLTMAGATAGIVAGAVTANPLMIAGGVGAVINEVGQIAQHSIQPDQARGNMGGGSLNTSLKTQDFFLSHMTIKQEYAKRIDEFFSVYGYKVNALKVPNVTGRKNWNYVKTIDVNIDGAIPAEDMAKLKSMYDNGVTFWHNPSSILDYSKDNQ